MTDFTPLEMFWLADLVLAIHFALAAFVASGLLLIPIGAICNWQWVRNKVFRTVHAGLMVFVAFEALIGMTCPLTTIEAYLRGTEAQASFLAHHLSRLLYWDLPLGFFLWMYVACAVWVMFLWWYCPPISNNGRIGQGSVNREMVDDA